MNNLNRWPEPGTPPAGPSLPKMQCQFTGHGRLARQVVLVQGDPRVASAVLSEHLDEQVGRSVDHGGRFGEPGVALSLTPVDNPFQPVIVRGRVVEWLEGDRAWEIVDRISTKYTGGPYSRDAERVVAL